MRSITLFVIGMSAACAAASGCRSPFYADRGAGLGAITGALAGAAIGGHNGDALAGAVLGSAAGGLAGAAIGQSIDDDIARNQAIIEERMGRRMTGAATVADVIQMSKSGLGDEVIITHVRNFGMAQPLQISDLITLRNAAVSNRVITAMQEPPAPIVAAPGAASGPVVIEEYYLAPPPPWQFRVHRHHHHRGCARGTGFSWGFSLYDP